METKKIGTDEGSMGGRVAVAVLLTLVLVFAPTVAAEDFVIQNETGSPILVANGSSSNVGVGKENPLSRLDIQGGVDIRGTLDLNDNNIANYFGSACGENSSIQDVNDDGTFECVSIPGSVSDLFVNESGDNMTGMLNMSARIDMEGNRIIDLGDPSVDGDAVNRGWADLEYLNRDGSDSMAGQLDMAGNDVVNVGQLGDVDSTALVGNLNADLLDGMSAVEFENESHAAEHDGAGLVTGTGDTLDVGGSGTIAVNADSIAVEGNSLDDSEMVDNGLDASSLASGAVTAAGNELASDVAGAGLAYNNGALNVSAGTGLEVVSDQVQVSDNVALLNQDETITAGLWTFENDVQVQGDLDVFGQITNTDVNNLNVNGSLLPPAQYDNTFDVGNGTRRWRDVYVAQNLFDGSSDNFFEDGNLGAGQRVSSIGSDGSISTATINHDNLDGVSFDDHHGVGNAIAWDASDNIAVDGNSIDDAEVVDDGLDNSSLAQNAVTASGGELDSSVAGSGLDYNGGQLDVTDADTLDGHDASDFLELDGSDSMNGSLDLGGNDLVDGATVVWDASNSFVPQDRLENDQVTVNSGTQLTGGGSVSLGGSITLNVDEGAGSGLDADLLDGRQSDWYENDTHASEHAGTLLSASGDTLNVQEGNIDHGNISGLGDDDHTQYLELDGSDSMNGTFDLGGNNVALNGGWVSNDGQNEGLAIDNSGNVGVGTDSPSSQLDVNGNADVRGNVNLHENDVDNVSRVDFGGGMSVKKQGDNVVITDS